MPQSHGAGNGQPSSTGKGKSSKKERCSLCDGRGHTTQHCIRRVESLYEEERGKAKINFEDYKDTPVLVTTPGTICEKCKRSRTEDGIGRYREGNRSRCPCIRPSREIEPIKKFKDLQLDEQVFFNIKSRCAFKVPTPIQRHALPIISKGFDVMGCAQTGTGKTAAYLIPMIQLVKERGFTKTRVGWDEPQKPEVLIVAPTRELAQQIHSEALKLILNTRHPCGIKVIYGGARTYRQRDKIRQGCNILIGTPGRIKHFINDYTISLENTEFLVLDEADKMIDDGFRPEIELIVGLTDMPKKDNRQNLLFSATFRSDLQDIAAATMRKDFRLIEAGVIGSAQPDVTQEFECADTSDQKRSKLMKKLLDIHSLNEITFFDCNCWKNRWRRNSRGGAEPGIRDYLLHVLGNCAKEKILIFVETKRDAQDLAYSISDHLFSNFRARFMKKPKFKDLYRNEDDMDIIENFGAISFHANKGQNHRESAVKKFDNGTYPILVATNVAARGLDFKDVTLVINYHLPFNLSDLDKYWQIDTQALKDGKIKKRPVRDQFEEYIHRIGRTGRAGKKGKSLSFFQLDKDRHLAIPFIRMLATAQQEPPEWLLKIAEEQVSIGMARRKKGAIDKIEGSQQPGVSRNIVKKEWDDSQGPSSSELWSNEP